jgi:ATP-dependent RNA helicase HelY
VLGFWEWRENLERGVAAHHAGLLPAFKEIVEELFQRKLVKVVFATETLALGINMPARTVVLEKLEKFNGEARVAITSGEYTQLTGRAGGAASMSKATRSSSGVSLDPQAVAALASRRTYPLNSSFRPTYNMAVNLIDQFGRARAREILESSFAQFQADRAVVGLAREVKDAEESLAGYAASMACDRGDFAEFARMRRELGDLERKGDRSGPPKVRQQRQEQIESLRRSLKRHPCQSCPDREKHARWAERYGKLRRHTDKLRQQIDTRTGTVARIFDRVVDVLTALNYVHVDADGATALTAAGATMKRIYGERDLLVAESLRTRIWKDLDPAGLPLSRAVSSTSRVATRAAPVSTASTRRVPRGIDGDAGAVGATGRSGAGPPPAGSSPVATGLAQAMHSWARGASLDRVLQEADLAAGDFVRWTKQTIDLLDQLSMVADAPLATTARAALDAVRRGIVAYGSY